MLNLYREEQGLEELLSAAELQSLIIATASLWDQCNLSWKAPTGRVLRTISKAQTKTAIMYLQAADCIKIAIQNLFKLADTLPASDICEAVSIILCFVKDSYPISSALLLEFENNDGYQLLVKILLRWEGSPHSEGDHHVEEVLDILTCLTVCGKTELKVSGNVTHPQLPHFDFEQTQSSGMTVKNLQAFQVLQSIFQKTSDLHLCRRILLAIKTMWAWDTMNFFLLEWTLQPISQFTDIIPLKPHLVQIQFFQLVESVVLELSYIPHEILKKVECLIKENLVPFCTIAALRCLHSITKRDLLFTDIFRDSGLLGQLLTQLRKQAKILRKTVVIKDYGMVPYIKIFLDDECYRSDTLCILEQLSVINTEEYMSIIIGALCSSTQGELCLKLDLLKSLLRILENPKCHSAFRTCSGFNGLLSLLSDMEGALQDPPSGAWAATGHSPILELVLYTLQGIAAALHLDPINSDFFQRNGLFEKLAEDLGSLGCFWTQEGQQVPVQLEKGRTFAEFLNAALYSSEPFPAWLKSCIQILSFLDHMIKGTLHLESFLPEIKPAAEEPPWDVQKGPQDQQEGHGTSFKQLENKLAASDYRAWADPEDRLEGGNCAIIHPGAVCVMVRLLPKLYKEEHPELSQEIQCAVADHVQSLVKSEKSRQVMCASGLLSTIITSCQHALNNDSHPLHLPLIRIFEKLASQSIEPDVLSCLFLPTLSTVMGPNVEHSISGGIGMGARLFPPSGGLTVSSWFLVSRFCSARDAHPLRFLTVVRHMSRMEQEFVCFAVSFSPTDRSLVISTEEVEFQPLDIMEPEMEVPNHPSAPTQIEFSCTQQLATGQWHHLTVTVAKETKRSCIVSAYINGQILGSAKMQYIQPLPGNTISMEPSSFVDIYGYIATPRVWKQKSSLAWRLGPTYLFEESISGETVEVINKLGPRYFSNFQAVQLPANGHSKDPQLTALVAEERISFGINAMCSSTTTIQDIKSCYNEVDGRLIAKEMGIISRDSSTPVFLATNIAGHLAGPLRTIGSVAVGQFGVRVFQSCPAANSLNFIGGPAILLGLIAMARDDHAMYAAVKVLNSVLNRSPMSEKLMSHIGGYQLLAYLLRRKTKLLNNRILQLVLSIAGTAELGLESSTIKNYSAFQYVLSNFELWSNAPENLDLALFSHLVEILRPSRDGCRNAKVAYQMQMVPKLVFLLNDIEISCSRVTTICTIFSYLLQGYFNTKDILRIGLFLVYTLTPSSVDESQICLDGISDLPGEALSQTSGKTIWLRNQLLKMLLDVMCSDKLHLSSEAQEETFLALGPDWFLMFTQSHLHPSTVVIGVKLLLHFLHNPTLLSKFKEGVVAGRWVENSSTGLDILMDLDSMLQWLLQNHQTEDVLKAGLCTEAVALLLEMVKATVNKPFAGTEGSWEVAYPGNVMQFLCLIYHSYPQDPVWCCSDFLQTLATVVFNVGASQGGFEGLWPLNGPAAAEANSCPDPPVAPLPQHPAKKQVWDFLRILLMESLASIPAHKQGHPFELLLEASAENSTREQNRHFQTEVLRSTMDIFHIISQGGGKTGSSKPRGDSDPHGGAEVAVPMSVVNVSYFTQKLVEKLYSGMFAADPKQILLFVTEQIMVVMENTFSQKETVISTLYSSLNRAILYCLSRPQQSLPEQLSLRNTLHTLQEQWDIIFATYNSNISFTICLMHCLCQLSSGSYPEGFGVDAKPTVASYRQIFLAPSEEEKGRGDSHAAAGDVQQEILKTVEVTWKQLISQRRQALEDTYKIDLSVKPGDREKEVKIAEITPLWEETMTKAWQHFIASEKKTLQSKAMPAQSQSKSSSWSESLSSAMRLMPGKNVKETVCKSEGFVSCMEKYRRSGQELYASLYKDHVQMLQCGYSKAAKDWATLEEQLFTRGGPWGAVSGLSAPRWGLDGYEGPERMRKRIRFERAHGAVMRMRSEVHQATPIHGENQEELMLNGAEREMDERGMDCNQLTFFPALHESFHSEDFLELCVERQIILQEFAEREKTEEEQQHSFADQDNPGGGFSLVERFPCTRGLHGANGLSLQEIALEIFFKNGYSKFLVFHDSDRNKAFKRFCSFQPVLKAKGITEESLNIRKNTGGEKTMLQKWQKREISNFDYLMYLNTLAGRTYNDYMQYPVFPWILADYHSQMLNLASPQTYRDLSKPMGAQTLERKRKFIQRYHEVEKSEGDPSAQCHYCTHYSSAIIVASYLVRMEPFTQTFCSLQGGSFDVADRMFHSVKNTWDSASRENMSDVRELIPEFFYLPEFLTNCNHFEFGSMQDGTVLGDVQLPPWADGDPYKFIHLHRQALEGDYVSAHLHQWIDLIFGHKQHGSAAVEAVNTFHPYFYGDKVDLNNTSDPLIKSTILGFVSNFGQIPKQATGKNAPAKEAASSLRSAGHVPPLLSSLQTLKLSPVTIKEAPKGAIGQIIHTEKIILAVEKNKVLIPPLWNKTFCWGFDDFTCCLGNYGTDKNTMTLECMADWGKCLCAVCPTPTTVITSGTSTVVCVWELSLVKDKVRCLNLRKALYGHTQAVTCLAASVTYSVLVSGSNDRTCIIWDLNKLTYVTHLPAHRASLSAIAINDSTGDIASCAGSYLHLWTINGQPLASISTACGLEGAIVCCCFAEVMEWDTCSVIITGGTDGIVRLWKTEYAKAPGQDVGSRSQKATTEVLDNKGQGSFSPPPPGGQDHYATVSSHSTFPVPAE
ncbi:WD repeat- and FYVE domain-containing protein 4 [Chelonia mydas]|uniref:WD repeat-and FYVE domain-containing protein 4 n=1 Tax=Chelonia mydas TaxID=8469 RepID=M7B382_CHEMY|nr:WD repeat- and FYVE domain-containing protein 4 [Chelonia mydas]